MRKRVVIVALFMVSLFLLAPHISFSQSNYHENTKGGRKKENSNQTSNAVSKRRGLFKRNKSAGNADAFASNRAAGSGGFFYKLFHGGGGSDPKNASLRKTKPGKVQDREQAGLFRRILSPKKSGNENFLNRQRKERAKNRSRGSSFDK
ncbi:MAG TPA: hypothetical protein VF411_07005 [Bacteroidia bacterium]